MFCYFRSPAILNIGLALPFSLGNVLQIDIASDNNLCEENKPILSITDIFVRKLPKLVFLLTAFSSNNL